MNSLQKLLACLMLGFIVIGYGCKKDNDDPVGCSNWANEVTEEATAFSNTLEAYTLDPTPTKCQAFKDAAQAYLDALEDRVECATLSGTGAELQSFIDSSRASYDAIQC